MDYTTIKQKVRELEQQLSRQTPKRAPHEVKRITKEYKHAKELLTLMDQQKHLLKEIESLTLLIKDDSEVKDEAEKELLDSNRQIKLLEQKIKALLNPSDPRDMKNVIMEIRAGAGGDEAALFAADLFRMYNKFALNNGWDVKFISTNRTGISGFKEVILSITGNDVFGELKYESGVHRVQRIPETEKSGRVHTSTATVVVLPEAEEVDIEIKNEDLRIDTFTASGHGGQGVNTTYSAVRITHIPTGLVVSCQDERSQLQNKARALKVLRSRLLALQVEKQQRERAHDRKSQVGTGDRSEKIRTYNFAQDRITDHRIKKNWHNIQSILDGGLKSVVTAVKEYYDQS